MTKKRTRLEIIRDILTVIKSRNGKIKPTHILYRSNLSHQMLDEYLSELKGKEFILELQDNNSKTYAITDKGLRYLQQYAMIANFTDTFGLG